MPKIIVTSRYMKSGSHSHIGNYMKYIATREEVKENNPHVHIVVYSQNPKEGFLTNAGIEKIRSIFANDIYRGELQNLYQKQTAVRDKLRSESDMLMKSLVSELQNGSYSDPQLDDLILKLYTQLKNSSGKKQYGYLKPEVKKTVDAIVSCLAENSAIRKMYSEWCELESEKYFTYTSAVKSFPTLAENKVFKPIKNCVINTVLNMNCTLNSPECEIDAVGSDEIAVIDDAEPQEEVISESYFMKWSSEYKAARDILHLEKDTETALKLFKTEAQKGNVLAMSEAGKILEKDNAELSAEYFKKAYSGFLLIAKNTDSAELQYKLGVMTLKGIGCKADILAAVDFFKKSAAKDDPYAMYSLAKLYLGGEIPMRKDEAILLLEKSARLGNTVSSYALGKLYLFGREIERDTDKAKEWPEISAAAGNEYAKNLLENMDRYNQSAVRSAAASLLNSFGRMIYEDYSRNTHGRYITEHKLQNAIRRKKLALGIKDDRTVEREVKIY